MSEPNAAPQPQASAPVTPPPSAPPADVPAAAPTSSAQIGSGGTQTSTESATPPAAGEDWRKRVAGDDVKRLEVLTRYKSEADWANSWFEQREALSKRAEPMKLADNATPEQIADYRKALGLPEVSADAKPDVYMAAYGIQIPDGAQLDETQRGFLGDLARHGYEKGLDPRSIKEGVNFFLEVEEANRQALNTLNQEQADAWKAELRKEYGPDYDARLASANAYWQNMPGDEQTKNLVLNAQLPGGGLLKDHPVWIDLVSQMAVANGFGDRIEANAMESGGRPLADQQREIESLRFSDPARYDDPSTQAKLEKIIELRLKRGELDEMGNEVNRRRSA